MDEDQAQLYRSLGTSFSSYDQFEKWFIELKKHEQPIKLFISNSKTIAAAKLKTFTINPVLKYYRIYCACEFGGPTKLKKEEKKRNVR